MISALNVDRLRLDLGEYVLSVQHVVKRSRGRLLLDGADLDVKRGGCTLLLGPAGAGKTLLLACIAGAVKPSSGRIRYFGYELRGRAEAKIAKSGIVRTQAVAHGFGSMSVLESVMVGALLRRAGPGRARAHAREMLTLTGLGERAEESFGALDPLGRKRFELARALATDPQLLLLDDITAGLESPAAAALAPVLDAVRKRGITIVAAARTSDACPVRVDDIVTIDRGKTARAAFGFSARLGS